MAETECRLLAREAGGARRQGGSAHLGQDGVLLLGFEGGFEFEGLVEIVFDDVLVAPSDEHEVLNPCLARLVHDVLDGGAVEHRQHLFGHRLGGRQHARAKTGDGQDGLADGLHGKFPQWVCGDMVQDATEALSRPPFLRELQPSCQSGSTPR